MRLRLIKLEDAPLMLEWMHDDSIVKDLEKDFNNKTIKDCEAFIVSCKDTSCDLHLAVVDDDDNYMGTVSLKNIERDKKRAEFAIVLRKCAMGKGFSYFAMTEMIKVGFTEEKLQQIYWCLFENNIRARRFYDKCGYQQIDMKDEYILHKYLNNDNKSRNLIWYEIRSNQR